MLKISIIVPLHNAEQTLGACLDSLCALEYGEHEVILVDDGSTDTSAEIAAAYPFKFLRLTQNVGAGEARNQGCSIAQGKVLAFTDADCVVPSDWLHQIERTLQDNIAGVTGVYTLPDDSVFLARFAGYDVRMRFLRLTRNTDVFGTYNSAILRDAFNAVGGFNSHIRGASWEDVDFGLRVVAKGYSLIIDPANAVRHHHPDRPLGYFRKQASKAGGQVRMRLERRRSSYVDGSTTIQLPLTILFCMCLLSFLWLPWISLLGILSTLIALTLLNRQLFRVIAEHEDWWRTVISIGFVIFRNIAWCGGIIQALGSMFISFRDVGRKIG